MASLFPYVDPRPEPKRLAPIDPPEKRRQRVMFSGLHLLAGQLDLFPTDGHEEDTPAPEDLPELPEGPGVAR